MHFWLFLDVRYGIDVGLKISPKLKFLHTFNDQGVISAFALLILVCFLVHGWGYRFNPNLKFRPSQNFNKIVFAVLLILLLINICWTTFGGVGNNVFSVLFGFDVDLQSKYFTWPSFSAALEHGVLEESERYFEIMVLLIAAKNLRKWRIPIAVYGSTILFA